MQISIKKIILLREKSLHRKNIDLSKNESEEFKCATCDCTSCNCEHGLCGCDICDC